MLGIIICVCVSLSLLSLSLSLARSRCHLNAMHIQARKHILALNIKEIQPTKKKNILLGICVIYGGT